MTLVITAWLPAGIYIIGPRLTSAYGCYPSTKKCFACVIVNCADSRGTTHSYTHA